jgi:hypothetical protein
MGWLRQGDRRGGYHPLLQVTFILLSTGLGVVAPDVVLNSITCWLKNTIIYASCSLLQRHCSKGEGPTQTDDRSPTRVPSGPDGIYESIRAKVGTSYRSVLVAASRDDLSHLTSTKQWFSILDKRR